MSRCLTQRCAATHVTVEFDSRKPQDGFKELLIAFIGAAAFNIFTNAHTEAGYPSNRRSLPSRDKSNTPNVSVISLCRAQQNFSLNSTQTFENVPRGWPICGFYLQAIKAQLQEIRGTPRTRKFPHFVRVNPERRRGAFKVTIIRQLTSRNFAINNAERKYIRG